MRSADEESFRELVAGRSPRYLRTAYLLTGDWPAADAAVRAALARAYSSWRRLRDHDDVDAVVYRALVAGEPWWRRALHRDAAPPPLPEGADERERLRRALLLLPWRQRAAVVLRHYEDLPETEAARLLGCSLAAVRAGARTGLARLRDAVDDPYDGLMRAGEVRP
ncbi:MAG TPA: sigma factor-like helix-turn-helix DNA-binding protein [Mycobacteriales bacterium]|jgi:DNA-directed RNA polymerase specialized sigma24 family protein|nr:sigma factor-like helix-turn-helix DNA-binding protein [Mycobacteriales bacterium]